MNTQGLAALVAAFRKAAEGDVYETERAAAVALADAVDKMLATDEHPALPPVKTHKKNPDKHGFYTWKVELTIRVHKTWVADGFDAENRFTGDGARRFGENMLPYAMGDEVEVTGRVVSAPSDEALAKEMGYPNVDAFRATPGRTKNTLTWGIDDGQSNAITQGVEDSRASKVAQDLACERGETVYLYPISGTTDSGADYSDLETQSVEPCRACLKCEAHGLTEAS